MDIAIEQKKFNIAVKLLNVGGKINPKEDPNLKLVFKAAQYSIKLDPSDLIGKFDINKKNCNGDTVLHLMA